MRYVRCAAAPVHARAVSTAHPSPVPPLARAQAQKRLNRQRLRNKQPTQKTVCDELTSCQACGAVDGCAWCGSSLGFGGVEKGSGMCRRLDVNARLRGHPKMDGLTSGECEAKAWQTKVDTRVSSLSFNVFASDLKNARRRARTVFALVKRTDPTFIAFQEVEDWFLQALKLEPWVQNYYQSDFGSGHAPGGLYILSKYPLSKVAYNEQTAPGQVQYDQRARVLTVNAVINQTPPPPPPAKLGAGVTAPIVPSAGAFVLTLATTVLDWRSADARTDALDFVFATLSPYNDVLLMVRYVTSLVRPRPAVAVAVAVAAVVSQASAGVVLNSTELNGVRCVCGGAGRLQLRPRRSAGELAHP